MELLEDYFYKMTDINSIDDKTITFFMDKNLNIWLKVNSDLESLLKKDWTVLPYHLEKFQLSPNAYDTFVILESARKEAKNTEADSAFSAIWEKRAEVLREYIVKPCLEQERSAQLSVEKNQVS